MTRTQKRLMLSLAQGVLRTDQGNWTFGERASVDSLIRKGWAQETCGRLSITKKGRMVVGTLKEDR